MCQDMEDMKNQTLKEGMNEVALRMLTADKYALEEIVNISGHSLENMYILILNSTSYTLQKKELKNWFFQKLTMRKPTLMQKSMYRW